MPKLTEKEILARLDEVGGETLATIERLHRDHSEAREHMREPEDSENTSKGRV